MCKENTQQKTKAKCVKCSKHTWLKERAGALNLPLCPVPSHSTCLRSVCVYNKNLQLNTAVKGRRRVWVELKETLTDRSSGCSVSEPWRVSGEPARKREFSFTARKKHIALPFFSRPWNGRLDSFHCHLVVTSGNSNQDFYWDQSVKKVSQYFHVCHISVYLRVTATHAAIKTTLISRFNKSFQNCFAEGKVKPKYTPKKVS